MQIIRKYAFFIKRQKDPKAVFAQFFANAKNGHERSTILAAYRHAFGEWPKFPNNAFASDLAVAQALYARTLATPLPQGRSYKGATSDYEIVGPSDEARLQNKEWREKHGMVHIGARHVGLRPKQTVGRYSEALPKHWGAEMLA